jgi:hypothetical protein
MEKDDGTRRAEVEKTQKSVNVVTQKISETPNRQTAGRW